MSRQLGAYRVYVIYSLASALFWSIFASYNVVYYARDVALNPLQLVLVGTALELSVFLFEVPTGIVADVYSRRLSIIIGVFMIGVGIAIGGIVPTFAAVILSQIVWGIGYTFTSGATTAWLNDELGTEKVGPALLRASQLGGIGGLVGIVIGTALATIGLNLPVIVGGIGQIGVAVFLVLFMPETNFTPTPREDRSNFGQMRHTFAQGIKVVRGKPLLVTLLVVTIIWGASSEGFDRLSEKHMLDSLVFPSLGSIDPIAWFGILSIAGSIIGITIMEVARRKLDTTDGHKLSRSLFVLTTLLVAGIVVFALTGNFWIAAFASMVIGQVRGLRDPLFHTWLNQQIDSRYRATVLSMYGQADALGQITMGPGVGFIGLQFGVRAALVVAAVLLTPVLPLHLRTHRQTPIPEAVEEPAAA